MDNARHAGSFRLSTMQFILLLYGYNPYSIPGSFGFIVGYKILIIGNGLLSRLCEVNLPAW